MSSIDIGGRVQWERNVIGEVPIQSPISNITLYGRANTVTMFLSKRRYGLAFAGHNPRDLCRQSNGGDQGQHSSESPPYFGQCAGLSIAGKIKCPGIYSKAKAPIDCSGNFPHLQKVLGAASIISKKGYFGAAVGAVSDNPQIKQYIKDQSDDPNTFKVWDQPEPTNQDFESDSPKNSGTAFRS